MDGAINRHSGKYILAEERLPGAYTCPVCRAPVTLRAGTHKKPYFAHKRGFGTPECYLYKAVDAQIQGTSSSKSGKNVLEQLKLSVELSTDTEYGGWGLILSFSSDRPTDIDVSIEVGHGRVQSLRLLGKSQKVRGITAELGKLTYKAIVRSNELTDLPSVVLCDGLLRNGITTFGPVGRPGLRYDRAGELILGRSYVCIWHTDTTVAFPVAVDVDKRRPQESWNAALVSIPSLLDEGDQRQLQEILHIPIANESIELIPLWPPFIRKITSGHYHVANPSLVVLYAGLRDCAKEGSIEHIFSRDEDGGWTCLSVNECSSNLVQLTEASRVEEEVRAMLPEPVALTLEDCLELEETSSCYVAIVFSDLDGSDIELNLLSDKLSDTLQKFRRGEVELKSVLVPSRVSGKVSVFKDGEWQEQLSFSCQSDDVSHGVRIFDSGEEIKELRNILTNLSFDVLLDFDVFGWVISSAENFQHAREITIPLFLKKKVLSFIFQRRHISPPLINSNFASDKELIQTFLALGDAAHDKAGWRSLKKSLESFIPKTQ